MQTYNMMSWLQCSRANLQYDVYDYNAVMQTYNMMSWLQCSRANLQYDVYDYNAVVQTYLLFFVPNLFQSFKLYVWAFGNTLK